MTAAMVGVVASSSTSATQQGKRKQCATWVHHTKRQRHSQAIIVPAVAAPPLQMAFPITGVNGAAPRWSTAAALGAASRAVAALPLPPPVMVASSANGPGGAKAAPQVLARAAAGQLVPVPVRFYGYMSTPPVAAPPALPLAAALDMLRSATLARMLSVLTPACHPPLRQHESRVGAAPPPWWPTASERWWAREVAAHLPWLPRTAPVPFVAGKQLRKAQRVAVLVAIVKHLSPDFRRIANAVRHCDLSASEAALWNNAIEKEKACCVVRPVFVVQMQQHAGNHLSPSWNAVADTGGVTPPVQVVAAAELKQPQEQNGSCGAHIGAMVTVPSTDEGHQVESVEAEPEELQPEQDDDVDATGFSASDLGDRQLEDMLLPLPVPMEQADDLHQIADDLSGMGNEFSSAAAAAAEAKEEEPDDRPWYENEELRRNFAHMPIGSPHSFDSGWYF